MLRLYSSILFFLFFLLSACTGLWHDDNVSIPEPLTAFPSQLHSIRLWSKSTGGGKIDKNFLKLEPVIKDGKIFTSNESGWLAAFTLNKGRSLWKTKLHDFFNTSFASNEGIVAVATTKPELIVMEANNGAFIWHADLPNQILAAPSIKQGYIIVKTIDGKVLAFSLKSGRLLWTYNHEAPTLVLRISSTPQIVDNKVLVGFSDGTLAALNLIDGKLLWERTVAYPKGITQADQLIDIAADLRLDSDAVYTTTYQGNLCALSLNTGKIKWRRPFSSYSGLAIGKNLYATDCNGGLWAFDRLTGQVIWKTYLLRNRGLTAPTIIGTSILVADNEGYLHWFSQKNGEPLARIQVDSSRPMVVASPVVSSPPLFCILTQQGELSGWTQKR